MSDLGMTCQIISGHLYDSPNFDLVRIFHLLLLRDPLFGGFGLIAPLMEGR